jgi:hypothetical protein
VGAGIESGVGEVGLVVGAVGVEEDVLRATAGCGRFPTEDEETAAAGFTVPAEADPAATSPADAGVSGMICAMLALRTMANP